MAIGHKPPSILTRAINFALKKKGLSCLGTLPSPIRFRSLASDFRKMSPALPFDLLIRFLKFWGTIFSGQALEPFEKTLMLSTPGTQLRKNFGRLFSIIEAFISFFLFG